METTDMRKFLMEAKQKQEEDAALVVSFENIMRQDFFYKADDENSPRPRVDTPVEGEDEKKPRIQTPIEQSPPPRTKGPSPTLPRMPIPNEEKNIPDWVLTCPLHVIQGDDILYVNPLLVGSIEIKQFEKTRLLMTLLHGHLKVESTYFDSMQQAEEAAAQLNQARNEALLRHYRG